LGEVKIVSRRMDMDMFDQQRLLELFDENDKRSLARLVALNLSQADVYLYCCPNKRAGF